MNDSAPTRRTPPRRSRATPTTARAATRIRAEMPRRGPLIGPWPVAQRAWRPGSRRRAPWPRTGAARGRRPASRAAVDVLVDGTVRHVALADAVDRVQQPVAREHAALRVEQRGEQPELERAQGHGHAVTVAAWRPTSSSSPPPASTTSSSMVAPRSVGAGSCAHGRPAPPARRVGQVVVRALGQRLDPGRRRGVRADSTRMGTSPNRRARRMTSIPSSSGIMRSSTTRRGWSAIASRAAPAGGGRHDAVPLALEVRAHEGPIFGSSSTTRIGRPRGRWRTWAASSRPKAAGQR